MQQQPTEEKTRSKLAHRPVNNFMTDLGDRWERGKPEYGSSV
jgi:hypothetical protein